MTSSKLSASLCRFLWHISVPTLPRETNIAVRHRRGCTQHWQVLHSMGRASGSFASASWLDTILTKVMNKRVFLSWKCLESKHQLWHISGEVFSLSFRPPFSNTDSGYKYQSSYSKFKSTFLHLESFQNMWTCGPIFKLQPPQKSPKVRVITQCSSLWRRSWLH